tara:strand:+ start:2058 stop:4889 length:2832 start_codon:yes stop_codon:yes gene_type:complete
MKFKEFIDIDSLKHAKIDEKPVKNYSGDYKELSIAKPSSNGSDKTYQELKTMQGMFKDRTPEIEKSVKDHDDQVGFAVKEYLKENKLKFREEDINKLADVGSSIVRYYKNKFERVRPYQLAEAMNLDFDHMPLDSDSMKSPAYPSGHSLQSRLIAEYYVEQYPEHKKGLIEAADECGEGRIYAGWHYPSDHDAAVNLAKQIYPNITMRKSFKEAVIDIPRRTYAPGVFNNSETNDPTLKPSVKKMIYNQIEEFEKEYPVLNVSLIGSILTHRYRNDADLDINVLFDVPKEKQEEERLRLSKKFLSANNPDNIQGKLIPGTQHPINYYIITDKQTYDEQNKKADAVYDIEGNKFIKRPKDFEFNIDDYIDQFNKKVQELDVIKGELKRDIIDYRELEELKPNDILNLQDKIKDKLEEIEDSVEQIVKVGDGVDADRRAAFDRDMSPDEIQKFGIKNRLPKAVIYKMLEKYHYLKFYKKCKKILEDGKVDDKEVDDLEMHEARRKSLAFTFGRFNPPTIGHEKLINKVASIRADDYRIYLSRSEDPKKNPLSPRDKLSIMKKMFPRHARKIQINTTNMILDIASDLHRQGFTEIFMVVGSDRVREFETILNKYNDIKSRHGYYNFDNINVVSAGERDPDAEGAVGMSASKMRAAASKNDLDSFRKGLPRGVDAGAIMKQVRKGMNLSANYIYMKKTQPIASLEEFEQQQIRDLYIRDQIFNIGDEVDYVKEDIKGKVQRKGTNYIVLEDKNNNLHKAWIWDCIPVAADREAEMREHNLNVDYGFEAVPEIQEDLDAQPQDKDVKKVKGTQPKKYYKQLSKDVKKKRADYFKNKDTSKNDNRPAPGDKGAKTKPSIHTKKFKKMYGEYYEMGTPEYTKHTIDMTPGQKNPIKKVKGFLERETEKPTEKDVKEWAASESTMNKYRERYKEDWKAKLSEVAAKMIEKL